MLSDFHADEVLRNGEESGATQAPFCLQTAASDAATDYTFQEIRGAPAEGRVGQPIRDAVKTVVGMEQQARYQAFLKDRQQRNTHHPKGTSKSMQGIFSLMLSFESITNPALQRQLLQHSLDLLELSRESAVQLLSHEAESAGTLMGLLREHAPDCPQDDHLLMLQGPLQDLEPRQVAAVRNPAVRMKCDHQTNKAWLRGWEQRTNASTADFCDTGGAAELAVKALFPRMQGWAHALQMAWNLRCEDPLEYSCVVEALMAAWVKGDLPSPAAQASVPYAHQVDLSKWESALGPGQVGAGPSLHATPSAPLPCHKPGPGGESTIAAGFPYTPQEWSSASATGLACVDDGCGESMAKCHQAHQPATNLTGVSSGLAILSCLFTRTNFHAEDTLLGAYNIMTYGAPKIWYVVPAASAAGFEAALEQQQGPNALAALTGKHLYCSLPLPLLKELGVKRFLQMPGYAVLTYPGAVYHWTISTGFSLAEATNLYVGPPGQLLTHLQDWYTLLCSACTQAVKEDNANVVTSLLGRVSISQAVVQVLLQGPLRQGKGSALHCQAVAALKQLQMLQNFMDD
ncbi:TPA: demethylase [Trebouxia sp. C0006]